MVDYHTPGGVDREGWQYATDFPATYHGKIGFTDYVRRRRWGRKCKLVRILQISMDYVLTRLYLYIFEDQRSLLLI
jgi:hypothetical protein